MTITVDSVGLDAVEAERRAELGPLRVAADVALLAQRNLTKVRRNVRFIVITTIQPTLQLVLFSFVFGSIVDIPGYRNLIVPSILIQTITFTAMGAGVGIANDVNTGMVERLRSLPIARSAFLVGRAVADGVRISLQTALLILVAGLIGFRFTNGAVPAVAAVVVCVMFGFALTCFSMWIGFAARDAEVVQAATFIPLLPLLFTSSAFSPLGALPGPMRAMAAWNPFTAAIDTVRGLAMGEEAMAVMGGSSLVGAVLQFGVWWLVIVGLFTTLSVRRYRTGR